MKQVKQIVLQHHDQGEKSIGDYVINVLPTTTTTTTTTTTITTTTTTTQSQVVLATIRSILETVDEAASLDMILAKIVAAIAKFYKKEPTSLFKSETCNNNSTCEKEVAGEKKESANQNLTLGSNGNIEEEKESANQNLTLGSNGNIGSNAEERPASYRILKKVHK